METSTPSNKVTIIKNLYLYLVSFVALMMVVISTGDIIQVGLKKYVFTKADKDFYYSGVDCGAIGLKRPMPEPVGTPAAVSPEECAKMEERNKQQAEDSRSAQRQRDLVRDISFILVGVPLFIYHWRLARNKGE